MKKYKVGFFKKEQGVFSAELISQIISHLESQPNIELFTGLDYTQAYVVNNQVFIEDFNLSQLDIYFWHDTVNPLLWQRDNYYLNIFKTLEQTCVVINDSLSTEIVNDKFLAHSILAKHQLPVADFALVDPLNKSVLKKAYRQLGPSVLLKPRFGGWGVGIIKIDDFEQLVDTIEYIRSFNPTTPKQILLEKFYPNDIEKWISVVVMGNKVLFGYQKQLLGNSDWKIYDPDKKDGKGQLSKYVDPSPELKEIALKAKKAINKDIICFDFIHTDQDYKIVDENGRPGLYAHCLQEANIKIEDEIVNLINSKLKK